MANIEIMNDPLQIVIEAAQNLYPDIKAGVQFNPGLKHYKILRWQWGVCGITHFDYNPPMIEINGNIPFLAMIETLAHELAHVQCGYEAGHNEEWEKTFDDIFKEYLRIGTERYGEPEKVKIK